MGLFLKILGIFFLLIVLAVVYFIWRIRRFLKNLAKDLIAAGSMGTTPSRIELGLPEDDEWLVGVSREGLTMPDPRDVKTGIRIPLRDNDSNVLSSVTADLEDQ